MADQEFLASFGVEIDESGVTRLQAVLSESRTLAEELASSFDNARASVQAFFRDLDEISLPGILTDQEFIASFGVEIDEAGVTSLQAALKENRRLAEEMASSFEDARASVKRFVQDLGETSVPRIDVGSGAPRVTEEPSGMNISVSLDFTKANKDLTAFLKEATKAFRLSADGSGVVSAGRNALSSLQSLFSSAVLPLKVQVETSGGVEVPGENGDGTSGTAGSDASGTAGSTAPAATGIAGSAAAGSAAAGATGTAGNASTGSAAAVASGTTGNVKAGTAQAEMRTSVSNLESILNVSSVTAPVTNNNSKNIQAPVSINVTAAGSNPEAVGQSVYNVAEQYLLRTLEEA